MPMRVHELHPALTHAPLTLLPASAAVEILALTSKGRIRRMAYDRVGRGLWWGTAGSALLAGFAGMAASQEVRVEHQRTKDAMWVHGIGNLTLVLAAFGVASWRANHRASLTTGLLGIGAVTASLYTAWLGGEMVYGQGIGVKAMAAGSGDSPALLSREGPGRLVRDGLSGLRWLVTRAVGVARRRDHLQLREIAPGSEQISEPGGSAYPQPAPMH
jgi:uncharacterized membrane protein